MRKRPKQERARQTVEMILDATESLVARHGWSGTTTNHIARRAGVSIGSVYQYFPDKAAILERILERHVEAVVPVITRFLSELGDLSRPIDVSLRALFSRLVAVHATNPRLNRVLEEEVPRPRGVLKKHKERSMALADDVARILSARPDVRLRRPLEAALILEQATEALTRWLVHSAPESLDQEACIDECVRLLTAYLRAG